MSRSKALIGIALIFIFGVVVGVALSVRLSIVRVKKLATGTPEELAILTVARIDKAVRFTPDQRVKAREIVLEAEHKIAAEQERMRPEVDAVAAKAHRELLALMTPQQLQRLPSSLRGPALSSTLPPTNLPEPSAAEPTPSLTPSP